jgi:hypothetical protein
MEPKKLTVVLLYFAKKIKQNETKTRLEFYSSERKKKKKF